jgi:hypothetical protein
MKKKLIKQFKQEKERFEEEEILFIKYVGT